MAELNTYGVIYNIGHSIKLWHNAKEDFIRHNNINNRYRFVLIKNGTGIISMNGSRFVVNAPALVCLNEKIIPRLSESANLSAESIYFHPEVINSKFSFENINDNSLQFNDNENKDLYFLDPFIADNCKTPTIISLGPAEYSQILKFFREVSDELTEQHDGFWPCRSRMNFIELLFFTRKIYDRKDPASNPQGFRINPDNMADKIILYLHSNYSRKITIGELAKNFYTNRTTISDCFKKQTGMTIMDYLANLRINIACRCLRSSNLTLENIIEKTGFNDTVNFGRAFKKATGLTPVRYRRKYSIPA